MEVLKDAVFFLDLADECSVFYCNAIGSELGGYVQICSSSYGWLLLLKCVGPGELFFFNPFTYDILNLPDLPHGIDSFCFQDPPTSTDCVIVGLSTSSPLNVFIHMPSYSQQSWISFHLDFDGTAPHSLLSPTIYDPNIYASNQGYLHVIFKYKDENSYVNAVVAEAPIGRSAQYFLVSCDQRLLLVVMDELGESVEVFKWSVSAREWEKIDSLGRHMIYICGTTCLCMEAKTPEMENKIYFPRLHSESGKILFYSLETCRYHTFKGRNAKQCLEGFFRTKYHVHSHAWI
ncbi:F-box/kelch-repeat protein At1g57790-like [Bidens hawaiensis]|uniref:F-box/kelch-repeat protein At1g57790-like n=1 Tax=Bidens hawaiensis TaxID=980011 RepID=UPI00404AB900